MSHLLKNLIIALCITILLGVVYYFTIGKAETVDEFADDMGSDVTMRTQKILADTQEINNYRLDVSIFDDARFRALKDLRIEIVDVNTGRANPFEPVQ